MISKVISMIILHYMELMILTSSAAAYQTGVSVNAPESVDSDFSVAIEIENSVDLDSGQFDLYFDSAAVNVTSVGDRNNGLVSGITPIYSLIGLLTVVFALLQIKRS